MIDYDNIHSEYNFGIRLIIRITEEKSAPIASKYHLIFGYLG